MDNDIHQLARDTAYDRYLRAVFAPKELQGDLMLIAAFFGEIARIPFVVSEPLAGEVRLQWWRDALTGSSKDAGEAGTLARQMRRFVHERPFASEAIERLLLARQIELYPEPMQDMAALDAWLDNIAAFDVALTARILNIKPASQAMSSFMAAGRAIAATDLALRISPHVARGRIVLPLTFFEGRIPHQCTEPDRIAALRQAYSELHKVAQTHLESARIAQFNVQKRQRVAVLPVALIEPYFRALQKGASTEQLETVSLAPLGKLMRCSWFMWRRASNT